MTARDGARRDFAPAGQIATTLDLCSAMSKVALIFRVEDEQVPASELSIPSKTDVSRRALASEIADKLRELIILGHFNAETALREAELAERFGVSRGPIREALKDLEREGIVVSRRNHGFVVAALTIADIEEIYELRLALEELAVRHATRKRTLSDLAAMARVLDQLADLGPRAHPARVAELDVAFHQLIYAAAHNKRIETCWKTVESQVFKAMVSRNVTEQLFSEVLVAQHQHIRYLIAERNEVEAVAATRAHLLEAYERLRAIWGQDPEKASTDPKHMPQTGPLADSG